MTEIVQGNTNAATDPNGEWGVAWFGRLFTYGDVVESTGICHWFARSPFHRFLRSCGADANRSLLQYKIRRPASDGNRLRVAVGELFFWRHRCKPESQRLRRLGTGVVERGIERQAADRSPTPLASTRRIACMFRGHAAVFAAGLSLAFRRYLWRRPRRRHRRHRRRT